MTWVHTWQISMNKPLQASEMLAAALTDLRVLKADFDNPAWDLVQTHTYTHTRTHTYRSLAHTWMFPVCVLALPCARELGIPGG